MHPDRAPVAGQLQATVPTARLAVPIGEVGIAEDYPRNLGVLRSGLPDRGDIEL
jgi:hypothetical protein